jgi:drug/metabolite transporter (DMT)-like permease
VPPLTFAMGVGGIFGAHALFFTALRLAPAVEVNLLQYLWPLLIVVLSPLYLGTRLAPHHLAGGVLGLAGAALVLSGGKFSLDLAHLPGYLLAVCTAFVWASYSLLTKRVRPFPTGAVGGFCLASGLLSLGLHGLMRLAHADQPGPAISPRDWLFMVLLGLGPMGIAFYSWDAAMKRGDPRVIGALAYLTPLLSTLLLVLAGGGRFTPLAGCAMGLIVAGAVVGSLGMFKAPPALPHS